jgi:hypothetical protein
LGSLCTKSINPATYITSFTSSECLFLTVGNLKKKKGIGLGCSVIKSGPGFIGELVPKLSFRDIGQQELMSLCFVKEGKWGINSLNVI